MLFICVYKRLSIENNMSGYNIFDEYINADELITYKVVVAV